MREGDLAVPGTLCLLLPQMLWNHEPASLLSRLRPAGAALRHGQAKNVTVELAESNGTISLVIQDDGTGLSRTENKGGLGLHTMQHRAKLLGGSLEIGPARDQGTVVTCSFPGEELIYAKENHSA